MIGDKDLKILQEQLSTQWLLRLVWDTAAALGQGRHFMNSGGAVVDDHVPFTQRGVPALDLIDFDYGPNNAWWHTPQDTMDKLSATSLQALGDVLVAVVAKLHQKS